MANSSINRDFLDAMYQRLHEAERGRSQATNEASRQSWDSLWCSISCSINDYLSAHAPAKDQS